MDSDEEDSAEEDDDLPDNAENDLTVAYAPSPTSSNGGGSASPGGGAGQPGGSEPPSHVHGAGFRTRVLEGLLKSDFMAKVKMSVTVLSNAFRNTKQRALYVCTYYSQI